LLLGAGFFAIPGIGPVLVAGPFLAVIVSGLEGAVTVGGLSVIGAALYGIGIPKDSVLRYEVALKSDQYLVIVQGTSEEIDKARKALQSTNASEVQVHETQPSAA
jgi:hypothetical protein